MKYFLLVLLALGLYAGLNMASAGSANKDFAQAIQVIVDKHAGSVAAERVIADAIRKAAEQRGIELAADAIEVRQSSSDVGGGVAYVIAKATVTYERRILPFYSKRMKITRVNQWGG